MEHYCGYLVRAIKSRRFPYSNLSNHISNVALIQAVSLIYNLDLTFTRSKPPAKAFSTPECMSITRICLSLAYYCFLQDPKSLPLAPNKITSVSNSTTSKIAISLATRYNTNVAIARKYIPQELSQWGKVSRLDGGDTVHARDLVSFSEKDRDASYVRVSVSIFL